MSSPLFHRLSALQKTLRPSINAARLIIFSADHGITKTHPSVSAYGRQFSALVFRDIASGNGACTILCGANDCALNVVDVGLDADVTDLDTRTLPSYISVTHDKVTLGSKDMTVGPAMTPEETLAAQAAGRAAVDRAVKEQGGKDLHIATTVICVGEVSTYPAWMDEQPQPRCCLEFLIYEKVIPILVDSQVGIGNTTVAAAIVAAITGEDPIRCCGRGSGLDASGLHEKVAVVSKALEVNSALISTGPQGILQAVGGLEIAGMVGAYLQASDLGIPAIVDGFISGAAALLALRIDPSVARCLFWSHRSDENGATVLLAARGESEQDPGILYPLPPLSMGLRLGEGTGAVLALPILRSAAAIITGMDTFQKIMGETDH